VRHNQPQPSPPPPRPARRPAPPRPPRSYGFAYGDSAKSGNPFIGTADFALASPRSTTTVAASFEKFFFTWAFSAAAATIVAGAIAERVTFWCYAVYSFIMSGFVSLTRSWELPGFGATRSRALRGVGGGVGWTLGRRGPALIARLTRPAPSPPLKVYPIVVHALWSRWGFLSPFAANPLLGSGAIDFAGGVTVHTVGGVAALIGTYFIGPRLGRFDVDGEPARGYRDNDGNRVVLGTFLLWFGW
jgi:Amt family ammonium transporter